MFELAEAALDEVTFLVDGFVEVEFCGPRGIAGDNGGGAGLGEGDAEVVGIVSGIGQDEAWSILVEQSSSLWGIAALSGGQDDPDGAAEAADGEMDLGAPAATRAAESLISSPFFAPAACRWARTMVLSRIRYSKSRSPVMAAKMRCQTPLALQRLKRRKVLFQCPKACGRQPTGYRPALADPQRRNQSP